MGSFNTRARTTLYLGNTRPRPGPLLICQYQELTRFPSAPSDQRRFQGSINKHGNPRLRTVLVEASWRLMQFQPDYKAVAKWRKVLADPKPPGASASKSRWPSAVSSAWIGGGYAPIAARRRTWA